MKIIAPYRHEEKKFTYSSKDKVERGGYIPNDKKIDEFINSGLLRFEMRRGSGEYEISEEESEFEADSDEYLAELTKQAEDFEEVPLLQHLDKMTAVEVLDNFDKTLEMQEGQRKRPPNKGVSAEEKVIKAIEDGFEKVSKKANPPKAEAELH